MSLFNDRGQLRGRDLDRLAEQTRSRRLQLPGGTFLDTPQGRLLVPGVPAAASSGGFIAGMQALLPSGSLPSKTFSTASWGTMTFTGSGLSSADQKTVVAAKAGWYALAASVEVLGGTAASMLTATLIGNSTYAQGAMYWPGTSFYSANGLLGTEIVLAAFAHLAAGEGVSVQAYQTSADAGSIGTAGFFSAYQLSSD